MGIYPGTRISFHCPNVVTGEWIEFDVIRVTVEETKGEWVPFVQLSGGPYTPATLPSNMSLPFLTHMLNKGEAKIVMTPRKKE